MKNEPISTINSTIYRNIADTINKTKFELYVPESYQPVVHGYYLDHPNVPPIHTPDPMESDNLCWTMLPLKNIIDMLNTGVEFRFKNSTDVRKASDLLTSYIKTFDKVDLSKDPAQKAFIDRARNAAKIFDNHAKYRESCQNSGKKKRLSLIERIRALGF